MFEVRARYGISRTGIWSVGEHGIATPNVLFAATQRHAAPEFAEALLSPSPVTDARPVIVDAGSGYRPAPDEGPLVIPPDWARPTTLPELARPATPDALILVASTASDVESHPEAEVVAIGDAIGYLRRPKAFVAATIELRRAMGYRRLLYAPGLGTPGNLALLAYCGVDLVDSTRVLFESTLGRFHTPDGAWALGDVDPSACSCPACRAAGAGKDLEGHNTRALFDEVRYVGMAVRAARIRELAERRAVNDPWSTAVLRELDLRHAEWQEYHTPVAGGPIFAYTAQSLHRPEVNRFRRRIVERYARPPSARVLLLLPCSARKPYQESRSHRRFRDAVRGSGNPHAVHEVIVTSPFGLVPRELERTWPVAHYDVPVTGDWSRDEIAVVQGDLRAYLDRNQYDAVVAHLTTEAPFVREVIPDARFTARERPTDDDALAELEQALRAAVADLPGVKARERMREDLRNQAVFQFGPVGAAIVDGSTFRGRYPYLRIFRGEEQLGMATDQGKIALTLAGGRVLSENDAHWVEIEDFHPEGSVFAVGVTAADEGIRVGDEVVVRHGDEVRAVGVAAMNPKEMADLRRGEAVKVRHRAKKV